MAEPRTRPPIDNMGYGFEEPLYADSPAVSPDLPEPTPWWEVAPQRPASTGERVGAYGRGSDGSPSPSSPRQRGVERGKAAPPPFYSEFLAAKPGGASPRFHDYHLESIERGLKQTLRIETLRVQLLKLKKQAAEAKKPEPKRRRPQPAWAAI